MLRTGFAAFLLVLGLVAAAGCGGGATSGVAGTTHTSQTTPVSKIVAHPQRYDGRTVTVVAAVSRPMDHRVWEMANGRLFTIKDDSANPAPKQGERMRITGTVVPFRKSKIEGQLGIDIEDHFYSEDFLADDVPIVVESLTRLSG